MENLGGEEIERALMDLGPLLGVSIKEEITDDATDTGAPANNNVRSLFNPKIKPEKWKCAQKAITYY